jgi:hypothetical protein
MGVPDEQIARIHAPIGIKVGAKTPEEIASVFWRDGRALRGLAELSDTPVDALNPPTVDQAES